MNIRQTSIICQECGNDIKWKGAWTEMPHCRCGWRIPHDELRDLEFEYNVGQTVTCGYCATQIYKVLGPLYLHEDFSLDAFIGMDDYDEPKDFECPACHHDWRVKKDGYWYFRTADGKLKPERGRALSEFELTKSDGEG